MKKIFNVILGLFIRKKPSENVICDHQSIKYIWSNGQRKYSKIRCGSCGKDLSDE